MARGSVGAFVALVVLIGMPCAGAGVAQGAGATRAASLADSDSGDLVVVGTTLTATTSGGVTTATVDVLNTAAADVPLQTPIVGEPSCVIAVAPTTLPPNQGTTVTLTLQPGCPPDMTVTVDLDDAGPLPVLTVKPVAAAEATDWDPMAEAAVVAAILALVVGGWGLAAWRRVRTTTPTGRKASYDAAKAAIDARLSSAAPGSSLRWVDLPDRPSYDIGSEVANLEAGWSLQDSWVSNLTVVATAFITLATSADLFTSILGEEPETALGVMTVSGLLAAVVIGLANTTVKLIGPSTKQVTVAGLLVSTVLVVFAAGLQVLTVGLVAADVLGDTGAAQAATALMLVVGAALVLYGGRTVSEVIKAGPADDLPDVPPGAHDPWQATQEWERSLVEQRIRATYADWLEDGSSTEALDGGAVPGAGGRRRPRWVQPRASML